MNAQIIAETKAFISRYLGQIDRDRAPEIAQALKELASDLERSKESK